MPNIPRYLITTADERTWKFDRPVLFLGEWCRLYDRKHVWQGMDAIVAAPYGLGQAQKDADHAEARALEEMLFPILCDALNRHHGTQHGARFWRIILGHWLRRYVVVMLNRIRTLEQCLQSYQITGTSVFISDGYTITPTDTYAATWVCNDDRWNNAINARILNLLGAVNFPVEIITGPQPEGLGLATAVDRSPPGRKILRGCYRSVKKLAGHFARESDAFIINSYLPKKQEILLQLTLGQVPQLWISPKPELADKPDYILRQSLSGQASKGAGNSLLEMMRSSVFELLPICFLEGFSELAEKARQSPWPKKPKFIFTSNNFATDEVFKLWTATKVESGTRYIIGQHGCSYGTHRYLANQSIEEKTADVFLTWGWTDGLPQHTPAFAFNTAGRAETYDPQGGVLLIEIHSGLRWTSWDITAEFKKYFEDQQNLIRNMREPIRKHLTVRLHHAHTDLSGGEAGLWREFDPSIKLDPGFCNISKQISQNRLSIFSYDSTGILENLSQNIPILAFWQNGFDNLRDSAKPYYQLLVDAGIVHLTPESAAAKVNEVWDDVAGWWMQDKVQNARKQFCDRYARVSSNPVRDLKKILSSRTS